MSQRIGRPGERFGRYVLCEWLGGGANADVWRAESPDGEVALKLLRSKNRAGEPYQRFVREVRQLEALGGTLGVLPLLDSYLPRGRQR
jgi:hypothetical protein